MPALTSAIFPTTAGRVAFGALSTPGTWVTLLDTTAVSGRQLIIVNSLDAEVEISLNNATSTFLNLPAQLGLALDLGTSMHYSGIVRVRTPTGGSAPTAGFISANIIAAL